MSGLRAFRSHLLAEEKRSGRILTQRQLHARTSKLRESKTWFTEARTLRISSKQGLCSTGLVEKEYQGANELIE